MIGRETFERDKEYRKLRQNNVITPTEKGISSSVLKIMPNIAKLSRTGAKKRSLDLVRY